MKNFILHQHVVGWRGSLDQAHAQRSAGEIAMLLENTGPNLGVAIYVGGYDDTDLELFDIPETVRYLVWVSEELARRNVDFNRLMPESRSLLTGCRERQRGRKVVLNERSHVEFWQDFAAWERYLRQKVH